MPKRFSYQIRTLLEKARVEKKGRESLTFPGELPFAGNMKCASHTNE